jgi:DNA-binding NarL/FixJ family response regulator
MLLDVNLPDGNGLAFLAAQQDACPRVLLTSTDPDAASAHAVQRSGAAGFVAKTELLVTDLTRYLG